jgi:adenine/guanine/hypoxanthine permease
MGLNAYFTYQVVGYRGTGPVPYGLALTAVFVEGFIFIALALTGMRHWLVKIIPGTIKTASGVGIGLFLTLIGMSYAEGIGIVTGNNATPMAIGGCPPEMLVNGACTGGIMTNPKVQRPKLQYMCHRNRSLTVRRCGSVSWAAVF